VNGRVALFCRKCGGEVTLAFEGLTMTCTERHHVDCPNAPRAPEPSPVETALRADLQRPAVDPPHPICWGPGLGGWRG
jgi:hypothetical protein